MKKINKNTKIKEWYYLEFPDDILKQYIKKDITFYDIFLALYLKRNIYKVIGINDSVIRTRIFDKLCDIMKVNYSYIYDLWTL